MGDIVVRIKCPRCNGQGKHAHYIPDDGSTYYFPTDPYHMKPCKLCNGFKVLIATGIHAITDARLLDEIERKIQ